MTAISEDVERCRRGDPAATEALARRACRLALQTSGAILRGRDEAAVHALLSRGRAGLRADPQLAQLAPGGPR